MWSAPFVQWMVRVRAEVLRGLSLPKCLEALMMSVDHRTLRWFLRALSLAIMSIPMIGFTAHAGSAGATGASSAPIVQNVGQWPEHVDFRVGAFDAGPVLDDAGVSLTTGQSADSFGLGPAKHASVRISFPSHGSSGAWESSARLDSPTISYIVGDDEGTWRTAVPIWREAHRALNEEKHVVVTGDGPLGWSWRIESSGAASPAALGISGPASIRLEVEGAREIRQTHAGVIIDTDAGEIALPPLDGDVAGVSIAIVGVDGGQSIELERSAPGGLGGSTLSKDSSDDDLTSLEPTVLEPTILDPAGLIWGTYFGGSWDEKLYTLDVDAAGNVYVAGSSSSPDLPVTPGAFDPTLRGGQSAFVARLSSDGARMEFLTFLGGRGIEYVKAVEIDHETGDVILGGDTTSSDFPTTADADRRTAPGGVGTPFSFGSHPTGRVCGIQATSVVRRTTMWKTFTWDRAGR